MPHEGGLRLWKGNSSPIRAVMSFLLCVVGACGRESGPGLRGFVR